MTPNKNVAEKPVLFQSPNKDITSPKNSMRRKQIKEEKLKNAITSEVIQKIEQASK